VVALEKAIALAKALDTINKKAIIEKIEIYINSIID
jgi:hypothetical protein